MMQFPLTLHLYITFPTFSNILIPTLWVRIPLGRGLLDTTLCDKVWQWFRQLFSPGPPVSSTNNIYRHDITEILALSNIILTHNSSTINKYPLINYIYCHVQLMTGCSRLVSVLFPAMRDIYHIAGQWCDRQGWYLMYYTQNPLHRDCECLFHFDQILLIVIHDGGHRSSLQEPPNDC
jgi:hypothetical protein